MRILKTDNGFTLLQLITTLLVIAVVSAMAAPSFLSWIPEIRLKGAANALFSVMSNTKMNAVKENKSWAIVFDTANNRYYVCDGPGSDGVWTTLSDNDVVNVYCMDGSDANDPDLPANCSQRKGGIVFGKGDAKKGPNNVAIPADFVSYTSDKVVCNSRGTTSNGYVYIQGKDGTTSYAIGTLTTGVVRVFKSNEGAKGYAR